MFPYFKKKGPLGQGHTFAVGAAIAAKFMKARFEEVMPQTIYAYISDGGIQEEISQGSGRIAGALGLDNLIMFYVSADFQYFSLFPLRPFLFEIREQI